MYLRNLGSWKLLNQSKNHVDLCDKSKHNVFPVCFFLSWNLELFAVWSQIYENQCHHPLCTNVVMNWKIIQ